MKQNPFRLLTKFEWGLWITSVILVVISFLLSGREDWMNFAASIIGVTGLIFVAKGMVIGQFLGVVFSVFYAIISYRFRYYGEMLTYICMSGPMAVVTAIAWLRHPFQKSAEVEVNQLRRVHWISLPILTALVTVVFYFILRALGTANLTVSTVSVATSFIAVYLLLFRSPYYAIGYAMNDLVLIILWVLASLKDRAYIPVVICFLAFFLNDAYAFYNWQKMKRRQQAALREM